MRAKNIDSYMPRIRYVALTSGSVGCYANFQSGFLINDETGAHHQTDEKNVLTKVRTSQTKKTFFRLGENKREQIILIRFYCSQRDDKHRPDKQFNEV